MFYEQSKSLHLFLYLFQRDTFGMMFRELSRCYPPGTTESAPDLTETLWLKTEFPPWQRTQECATTLSFDSASRWERRTSKEALHLTPSITWSVWGSIPQTPDSSWEELSLCHESLLLHTWQRYIRPITPVDKTYYTLHWRLFPKTTRNTLFSKVSAICIVFGTYYLRVHIYV